MQRVTPSSIVIREMISWWTEDCSGDIVMGVPLRHLCCTADNMLVVAAFAGLAIVEQSCAKC